MMDDSIREYFARIRVFREQADRYQIRYFAVSYFQRTDLTCSSSAKSMDSVGEKDITYQSVGSPTPQADDHPRPQISRPSPDLMI